MLRLFINQDDRRIITVSVIMLAIVISLSGLCVFGIMQPKTENAITSGLKISLKNISRLIDNQIATSLSNTEILLASLRAFFIHELERTDSKALRHHHIADFIKSSDELLNQRFSSIKIYDQNNDEIYNSGFHSQNPNLVVQLESSRNIQSDLIWDEQFRLRSTKVILDTQDQVIGRIVVEQTLAELTRIFSEATLIGSTGDFLLCTATKESIVEGDCFLRGPNGNEFRRIQRIVDEIPRPIHLALNQQDGIIFTKDYRGIDVVAAHLPVGYGLAAVLKVDKKELYSHLLEQVQTILSYLGILVLLGIAVLRYLFVPLIQKTIKSRDHAVQVHKELVQVKNDTEKISYELSAYINAISRIALISVTDHKGRIIQVNEKICDVSGFSSDELIGQDHRLLNSNVHPKRFFADMWTTVAKGEIWHREICNRSKSGTLYWIDSAIIPLANTNGKIDCYLSVAVDISARKQKNSNSEERAKENHCMHMIRSYLRHDCDSRKVCQNIVETLPTGLQFPDGASIVIELGNNKILSPNYSDDLSNSLQATIMSNGARCGMIQAFYPSELSFILPHEQNLIDNIAHELGRWYEAKQTEQRIQQMATHDALTGLPNRQLLQDRIAQALIQTSRKHNKLAVLFIDLDHFKTINDSLGHEIGDLLLKEVTERLLDCVRNEDTVARQGGDEFFIVLNSIKETLDAGKVAQKILVSLTRPYNVNKNELHIEGSIGIAVYPDHGSTAEALLKNSDAAMYFAKETGRNNFQFFTSELNEAAHEKHTLALDLRHALERNQLILHYQPIMDMPDSEIASMEALLRWNHPKQGMISPEKFIGLAEETGLIIPIGEWILETVCVQIKCWLNQGYIVPKVAINLSGRQFRDKELVKNIARILDHNGVEAKYISLEITESMLINDIEKTVETLIQINEMGIHISIDDFGTGYSSLNYLKSFPIQTLKIDRSFVRDIVTDKNDLAIVTAIIAMAHSLEMSVVAEGIETNEQLQLLIKKECNHYQGYYFSRPVEAEEIENLFKKAHLPRIPKNRTLRVVS